MQYEPGQYVRLEGMSRSAVIESIDAERKRAYVRVGTMGLDVPLDRLGEIVPPGEIRSEDYTKPVRWRTSGAVEHEIDLHGMRVEEALARVEEFLDAAIVNDLATVKIVHGYGSGRLRTAVREALERHPYVRDFHFGDPISGGPGLTIVHMKTG